MAEAPKHELSASETSQPGLKSFLIDALRKEGRGKRDFQLTMLRSQPKRCTSLFAWASDLNVRIYVEHLFVLVAERSQLEVDLKRYATLNIGPWNDLKRLTGCV